MNTQLIKASLTNLNTNWTWDAVANDPLRSVMLDGNAKSVDVVAGPDNLEFTMRYRPDDENLRIFTRNDFAMVQWRTDIQTGRGNRFVVVLFDKSGEKQPQAFILNHNEFTDNPENPSEKEIEFLKMIHPETAELLQHFDEALQKSMEVFKSGKYGVNQ